MKKGEISSREMKIWQNISYFGHSHRAAFGIQNVQSALIETAQTTLRDVVGARALQNVVSDREGVAHAVEEIVESVAEKWVNIRWDSLFDFW